MNVRLLGNRKVRSVKYRFGLGDVRMMVAFEFFPTDQAFEVFFMHADLRCRRMFWDRYSFVPVSSSLAIDSVVFRLSSQSCAPIHSSGARIVKNIVHR